mmetsp:Transcript_38662/g.116123  ORF Transcript_38662/g.116123 Transcript_38662/m.116123 type:complete len:467 (-) Transcript_38662:446-1846(-)
MRANPHPFRGKRQTLTHHRRILCFEPALPNLRQIVVRHAAPRVTLKVRIQAHNVMKPVGGQVQHIPPLKYHLVHQRPLELRISFQIRIGPIHGRMPPGRMSRGIQRQIGTLPGMREEVSTLAPEQRDEIPRSVEMILGRIPPHTEPAVDPPRVRRIDHVEILPRPEEGQFLEEVSPPVPRLAVEAEVPVRMIRFPFLLVGPSGLLQPVGVRYIPLRRGFLPPLGHPLQILRTEEHEMIRLGVVGPVRRGPSQYSRQILRLIPSFDRGQHDRIVANDERKLGLPVRQRLVVFRGGVESTQSLVDPRARSRVVGIPILKDVQYGPRHRISLGRGGRAVVHVVRHGLPLDGHVLPLSQRSREFDHAFAIVRREFRVVFGPYPWIGRVQIGAVVVDSVLSAAAAIPFLFLPLLVSSVQSLPSRILAPLRIISAIVRLVPVDAQRIEIGAPSGGGPDEDGMYDEGRYRIQE